MRIERIYDGVYSLSDEVGLLAYGGLDVLGEALGETLQTCDGDGDGDTVVCVCGCCWTDAD